jgi:hypothetical protein
MEVLVAARGEHGQRVQRLYNQNVKTRVYSFYKHNRIFLIEQKQTAAQHVNDALRLELSCRCRDEHSTIDAGICTLKSLAVLYARRDKHSTSDAGICTPAVTRAHSVLAIAYGLWRRLACRYGSSTAREFMPQKHHLHVVGRFCFRNSSLVFELFVVVQRPFILSGRLLWPCNAMAPLIIRPSLEAARAVVSGSALVQYCKITRSLLQH